MIKYIVVNKSQHGTTSSSSHNLASRRHRLLGTESKRILWVRSEVMSTDVRHPPWDQLMHNWDKMRISKDSAQTSITTLLIEDNPTQVMKQRKRRSDGSIMDAPRWSVDDLSSALQQACNDVQDDGSRLRMDADMLKRCIAAIEAQKQNNHSPPAASVQNGTRERQPGAQQRAQRICDFDPEAEQEAVLQ